VLVCSAVWMVGDSKPKNINNNLDFENGTVYLLSQGT